jgi:hypothetical protein
MALPGFVATGEPVASSWGNDVAYTLSFHEARLRDNLRGGISVVTTDVYGQAAVGFGHTFPIVPVVTGTLYYDAVAAVPRMMQVVVVSETGVVFIIHSYTGIALQSTSVTISWIATTGAL